MYDEIQLLGLGRALALVILFFLSSFHVVGPAKAREPVWSPRIVLTKPETEFGKARPAFCSFQRFRLIYLEGKALFALSFDGEKKLLFSSEEFMDRQTLSCTRDGALIAALNRDGTKLYVFTDALSIYSLSARQSKIGLVGSGALLSPDGRRVGPHAEPVLVHGTDVLSGRSIFTTHYWPIYWTTVGAYAVDNNGALLSYKENVGSFSRIGSTQKNSAITAIVECGKETYVTHVVSDEYDLSYRYTRLLLEEKPVDHFRGSVTGNGTQCIGALESERAERGDLDAPPEHLPQALVNLSVGPPRQSLKIETKDSRLAHFSEMSADGCWLLTRAYLVDRATIIVTQNPFLVQSNCEGK